MASFKQRWNITSNWQLVIIILVFAITGSSAALLSKPILHFFGISKSNVSILGYYFFYIILIFPIYQILLVSIGSLFGQHTFFWDFEKKLLKSMKLDFLIRIFKSKKNHDQSRD